MTLRQAGVSLIDCDHRTPPAAEQGYPYIAIPQLKDGHVDLAGVRRISESDYFEWTKKLRPRVHDVIVVRRCNSGDSALIPPGLECALGQNLVVLRSEGSGIEPMFLRWLVRGPDWWDQVGKYINVGAVFDSLRCRDIPNFELTIPPRADQAAIAEVLDALDDRIALLRETNATLEAIAQALFKSWFVDFDPVRAKQQGLVPAGMDEPTAALFPDSLEESSLGLIPKGWRIRKLGDVCSVTIGGLWGNDEEEPGLVTAICLRGVDIEYLREFGFAKNAPFRWVKPSVMEKRRLSESEVLVASSGAGPCGRSLWAGGDLENIYKNPVIFSNFVKRLNCGSSTMAIYVDRILANMRDSREIWNFINGTSIPNLADKLLLDTKFILVPDEQLLRLFESHMRIVYQRRYLQVGSTLGTLRDTLLPRLISGQLRLADAEVLTA